MQSKTLANSLEINAISSLCCAHFHTVQAFGFDSQLVQKLLIPDVAMNDLNSMDGTRSPPDNSNLRPANGLVSESPQNLRLAAIPTQFGRGVVGCGPEGAIFTYL